MLLPWINPGQYAADNLLHENYRLRDQQEQEVRKAIQLIKDGQGLALNQNKLINLEQAKQKLVYVYNSVK